MVGNMKRIRPFAFLVPFLALTLNDKNVASFTPAVVMTPAPQLLKTARQRQTRTRNTTLAGWVERNDGEWEWEEDDPNYMAPPSPVMTLSSVDEPEDSTITSSSSQATPKLPSGSYKPKQSLGQNYLKDPNTVAKILRAFDSNMRYNNNSNSNSGRTQRIIELGPGAGALTDPLVAQYGAQSLHCIEIDPRSVQLLREKHGPTLTVQHADVLQVDYADLVSEEGEPLTVIGNLPYYITSQILFALADAAHQDAVRSATVTMQWEVGQRLVAQTSTKDYGILSVVFQLYCEKVQCHFKIPPTVFYPQPKVDSALLGLHFLSASQLQQRLAGVSPRDLRQVVTATFQQRRKTVRNSLKTLLLSSYHEPEAVQSILQSPPLPLPAIVQAAADAGDLFAQHQALPEDWVTKRPEELTPGQFVELTRLVLGANGQPNNKDLGYKVWRKLKHGKK